MTFAHPLWLFGLLLPAIWFLLALRAAPGGVPLPTFRFLPAAARSPRRSTALLAMRALALGLVIVALAGPRRNGEWTVDRRWGVDLVLALDLSGSMAAEDLVPNRLGAAKRVLAEFISRTGDQRLGLVVFKARALTICPLTTDSQVVAGALEGVDSNTMSDDGTAIGDAIGTCLNRLAESKARTKRIVLLTDGENNSGSLSPLTAAAVARSRGIKIDTIAAGRPGGAPVPYIDSFGRKRYHQNRDGSVFLTRMDEKTLARMALWTGGMAFRASDAAGLEAAYAHIAKVTRSEVEQHRRRGLVDVAAWFLVPALALLVAELVLGNGRWRVLRAQRRGPMFDIGALLGAFDGRRGGTQSGRVRPGGTSPGVPRGGEPGAGEPRSGEPRDARRTRQDAPSEVLDGEKPLTAALAAAVAAAKPQSPFDEPAPPRVDVDA